MRRSFILGYASLLLLVLGLGGWLSAIGAENGYGGGNEDPAMAGMATPADAKGANDAAHGSASALHKTEGHRLQGKTPPKGIAIIVDDIGYDPDKVRRTLALPFPIALSILPGAPHAREVAEMAYRKGHVVMLHLPMQPVEKFSGQDEQEYFLRADMNHAAVQQVIAEALKQVPHASGINNHMGSLLTSVAISMRWIMQACRQYGLFFVDSRTSKDTVAAEQARLAGIAWGERRVFLDHTSDLGSLISSWALAKNYMARDGYCIVILHPYAETMDFLEHRISRRDRDLIVPITDVLHAPGQG